MTHGRCFSISSRRSEDLNPVLIAPSTLSLLGLMDRFLDNLNLWMGATPKSQHKSFDNLAIAGSEIHHMYSNSWRSFTEQIQSHLKEDLSERLNHFSDLHVSINGRYVLNPQMVPDFDVLSPLDWVERREPETHVVHSGHNHGLFKFGFLGKDVSITQGGAQRTELLPAVARGGGTDCQIACNRQACSSCPTPESEGQ